MKQLYLIRNGKAGWDNAQISDFERGLRPKGHKETRTIASYLKLRGIRPDLILSSCTLRAQQTADLFAEILEFGGPRLYLDELYLRPLQEIFDLIGAQDDGIECLFIIGHTPQLHELAHLLGNEHIRRFPPSAVAAIELEIDTWSQLSERGGTLDFFIYPKQFQYYMPAQIRAALPR